MSPDGTNVQRLTDNGRPCTHNDFFPNLDPEGKKIVFDSTLLTSQPGPTSRYISDLFLMNSDGTEQTRLTRGSSATWSPFGKDIAFHASASYHASGGLITGDPLRGEYGAGTSDSDIFVANVDDLIAGASLPKNITNSPDWIDEDADWSPDGTKIVFTRHRVTDPVLPGPPLMYPTKEIYLMNADGTGLTQLTDNDYEERAPAWSPDGSRIVFQARLGSIRNEVCVMDADGTNLVQLTRNALPDNTATWSPDGKKIVFHRPSPSLDQLWTIEADTNCNSGPCTCTALLLGGACETQLTNTVGVNGLANWGELRVHPSPGNQ